MIPAISSGLDLRPVNGLAPAASSTQLRADAAGAVDFGSMLQRVASDATQAVKGAEGASIGAIRGDTSTQAVVDAVMGAERALQTAVVLRDKVVAAYQEISRMAI